MRLLTAAVALGIAYAPGSQADEPAEGVAARIREAAQEAAEKEYDEALAVYDAVLKEADVDRAVITDAAL